MSSDLIRYAPPSPQEYDLMAQQAQDMIESKFLPRAIDTPQKALAIMMKGRELNLPPWVALSNIHIIEGKPTLSADLMAALVQRAIDQKGDGELTSLPPTDTQATVRYRRWGQKDVQEYTFSMKDAQAAGLTGRGPWKAHPKSMMRARALAHACRAGFPDVVAGMYDPDELQQESTIRPITDEDLEQMTPDARPRPQTFSAIPATPTRQEMATAVIDGEYVDKNTGEIQANTNAPSDEPANKELKQFVWDRAKEVFGDEGRTDALKTLLALEHDGTELTNITVGMANDLLSSMDDPAGVRAYVAAMTEPEPEQANDADTQLEHSEAEGEAWKQKIHSTPPSRWGSLYQEAFSETWKGVALINAAPHIGAVKMIEGRAKKEGAIEALKAAIDRRKMQLESEAKAS